MVAKSHLDPKWHSLHTGPWADDIQGYIDRINPFDANSKFEYEDHRVPDGLLVLVGPNDFHPYDKNTTGLEPPFAPRWAPVAEFKSSYSQLLESRVQAYSHAIDKPKLISVCAGSQNGFDPCEYIREVVALFNTNRTDGFQAFLTAMDQRVWAGIQNNSKYNGETIIE